MAARSVKLDEQIGEPGAEGVVWKLQAPFNNKIVKLYHEPSAHEERVRTLIPALRKSGCRYPHRPIAAPLNTASNSTGFVGVTQIFFHHQWRPYADIFKSRKKTLEDRFVVAHDLAKAVSFIHSRNFVVGDLNPTNLLTNLQQRHRVGFVDVDSWGYFPPDADIDHRLKALLPGDRGVDALKSKYEYLPPNFSQMTASYDSDRFALALLIIETLTGQHPFDCERKGHETQSIEDRIQLGHCWLFDPTGFELPTNWFKNGHPGLSAFPEALSERMKDALSESQPTPSAKEWDDAFKRASLITCSRCTGSMFSGAVCVNCGQRRVRSSGPPIVVPLKPHSLPSSISQPRGTAELKVPPHSPPRANVVPMENPGSLILPMPTSPPVTRVSSQTTPRAARGFSRIDKVMAWVIPIVVVIFILLCVHYG